MAVGHARHSGPAALKVAALFAVPLLALAQLFPLAMCQDYNLATLNKDSLARIDNVGVRLDLNLFRLDPKLLDTDALKYFVLLNNCKAVGNIDQRVVKVLGNELDYPKVAAFYRSKAAGILGEMPKDGTIALSGASLGPYDTTRKAFPIVNRQGKMEFSSVRVDPDHSNLSKYCLDAQRQFLNTTSFPNSYGLTFTPPLTFAELPMDEASARTYIEHTNVVQRVVTFVIDFRILDTPPQISRINSSATMATMTAEIEKITIVKGLSGEKVAVLYDRTTQNAKLR
jgi:hypothetical protein